MLPPVINRCGFAPLTYESGYLGSDTCNASLDKETQSHQRNLADKGSNRNAHTYFLSSLSLAEVKARGMFSFIGCVVLSKYSTRGNEGKLRF